MARGRGGGGATMPRGPPPLQDAEGDADDTAVSDEDVEFVQGLRGSSKLSFITRPLDEDERPAKRRAKAVVAPADDEEEYERRPRVSEDWKRSSEPAVVEALPTRTATGEWEYKPVEGVAAAAAQAMTSKDAKRQKAGVAGVVDERASGNVANHPLRQQKGAQLEELRQEVASASEKRERIAAAAAALIEAPEKNVAELKVLIAMTSDVDTTVSRLAAVSAMLVFKDVAPGYRIRPPTDKELEMAVSKEVKAVRDYESAFLKGYQSYLKLLFNALNSSEAQTGLGKSTATRCMCGLLRALPHFNYRTDLLRALTPLLASPDLHAAAAVKETVSAVLSGDTRGEVTLETAQLLAELVKDKACWAPPYTLDVLKSFRFSERLAAHLSTERTGDKPLTKKERNRKWIEERRRMRDDAKKASRKEASAPETTDHADDGLDEKMMRELDAGPNDSELMKMQTRTLEAVCEIYFRVLKSAEASAAADDRPLLGPTLDGLARIAHLIDYEVVADILEVLRQLVSDDRLPPELQAHCLLTVCKVLGGQDTAFALDTRTFDSNLYRMAAASPSLSVGGVRWSHTTSDAQGHASIADACRLWVKVLSSMLLSRGYRQVDTPRVAAFVKRLAEVSLHVEPGESIACLAIIRELLSRHAKLRGLLENDTSAPGVYQPDAAEPEGACALSSCLWEFALLSEHAHPNVAAFASHVAHLPVDDAPPPSLYGTASPEDLLQRHSTVRGGFNPPPPRNPRNSSKRHGPTAEYSPPIASPQNEQQLRSYFREAREFRLNDALRRAVFRMKTQVSRMGGEKGKPERRRKHRG